MGKKYKEFPTFETNEFKVGDLVRCYDSVVDRDPAIVEYIDNDGDILIKGHDVYVDFRTCRKLVEVAPKIAYLCMNSGRFFMDSSGTKEYEKKYKELGWVKVAEVLENEDG